MRTRTSELRPAPSFAPVKSQWVQLKQFTMRKLSTLLLSLFFFSALAEEGKLLSGTVSDASSSETLIGASIYVPALKIGTTTNFDGFYQLNLPKGNYKLEVSFIGYQSKVIELSISDHHKLNIQLNPAATALQEVVVSSKAQKAQVEEIKMSSEVLTVKQLKEMPAFMGEVDVLKAIQALPGVQSGGEGTKGFFVRGGAADQNLVLLDGATVYNPSHLMGFFSVFNADAIKNAEIHKGGIPAEYGGRSASLLEVNMRNGDAEKFHASGGIGLIASRVNLEGPIQKGKSSFLLAGRRTYADVFTRLSPREDISNSTLYFYDMNGRLNFKLGSKDQLSLSGYYGNDVLKNKEQLSWSWGNRTGSLNWRHLFNDEVAGIVNANFSDFSYTLGNQAGPNSIDWSARIQDKSLQAKINWIPSAKMSYTFGLSSIFHTIQPGDISIESEERTTTLNLASQYALESAAFASAKLELSDRLKIEAGLRYSLFHNIGGENHLYSDDASEPIQTTEYQKGRFHDAQGGWEPRFSLRYLLQESSSLKFSYNRMYQYLQLASNSTTGTPMDIYFPASNNIKPQFADQVALGYFHNLAEDTYELSAEVYYKFMQNQIDFRDNASLLLNEHLEREVLSGTGEAYGLELMLKKSQGKLNGWISYTFSSTQRTIAGINDGEAYSPRQDRPHSVNIVASYKLRPRLSLGAAWTYASGMPISIPTSSYTHNGVVVPVYEQRNGYRLPSNHRLDLSLTLDNKKKPGRKWESSWNFSIYNAYARQNPFTIQVRQSATQANKTEAVQLSLIGTIVPAVTYNFKF